MERKRWKGGRENYPSSLCGSKHLTTLRESHVLTCPKLYPDPVGVAGGLAKIEVTYDTVILVGIPVSSGVYDLPLPRPFWQAP